MNEDDLDWILTRFDELNKLLQEIGEKLDTLIQPEKKAVLRVVGGKDVEKKDG